MPLKPEIVEKKFSTVNGKIGICLCVTRYPQRGGQYGPAYALVTKFRVHNPLHERDPQSLFTPSPAWLAVSESLEDSGNQAELYVIDYGR